MAVGRAAYLQVWPEDGADDAAADVNHLGRAIYQIAHAEGWDALGDAPGLRPTGGLFVVVELDDNRSTPRANCAYGPGEPPVGV